MRSSVQSILDQTYENFEFIVIDDGSTDKTYEILLSFSDGENFIVQTKQYWAPKSLNRGLKLIPGELRGKMQMTFQFQSVFCNTTRPFRQ